MKLIKYKADPVNRGIVLFLCFLIVFPFQMVADISSGGTQKDSVLVPAGVPVSEEEIKDDFEVKGDSLVITKRDTIPFMVPPDSLPLTTMVLPPDSLNANGEPVRVFNPNPNRAVWLSALFPGLGQMYNRRYWKVPIVVGGFMGITYAMTWNGRMLSDYTKAYRDAMDNDPNTKSYLKVLNLTNAQVENINMDYIKKVLKSKKDYFRRNRDLSIICMVGLYLLCMVDAYVDASLAHFDISPDLSMNVYPALIEPNRNGLPSFGVQWALNF